MLNNKKMMQVQSEYGEVLSIPEDEYWKIFEEVGKDWETYLVRARCNLNSRICPVALQISQNYGVHSAISTEIARAISVCKVMTKKNKKESEEKCHK